PNTFKGTLARWCPCPRWICAALDTTYAELPMTEPILSVRNLETYYGPIAAIRGVSFDVPAVGWVERSDDPTHSKGPLLGGALVRVGSALRLTQPTRSCP